MSYFPLTPEQARWKAAASEIAERELAPRAAATDEQGRYPSEQLDALRKAGFWGLRASKEHGGAGTDLVSTALVVEELAKKCPSTAMCYKMHLEASEVICRMPTPDQVERFVKPLARGEVFTTVAGSESQIRTCTADFRPFRLALASRGATVSLAAAAPPGAGVCV